MTKPKTGTARNKPAAQARAAAEPRPQLVGDDDKASGVEQGAQEPATEIVADHGLAENPDAKINSDRLGYLECRLEGMAAMLASHGVPIEAGQDGFDVVGDCIQRLAGEAAELAGKQAGLERAMEDAGFTLGEGEDVFAAAATELRRLDSFDSKILVATGLIVSKDGQSRLDALIADHAAALDRIKELEAEDPAEDVRKALKTAVKHQVALFADLPDTAAITLRFAEGDEFICQVAPIDIGRHELVPLGSKAMLDRRIEFPPGIAPARVTAAWLIAGKQTLRCEIPGGLTIGGGHMAAIPAGHMEF